MKKTFLLAAMILTLGLTGFAQGDKAAKMTAEEVIAKHVASIGTPEDLAAVKSRVMVGTGKVSSRLGFDGALSGAAQFASTGDMVIFAMIFNSTSYPYEKAAYDGKDQSVGYPNGLKTFLASFLRAQNGVMKQGLFGGVLSSAWPLLDTKGNKAKVEYGGTTELNGKQAYKLKYSSGVGDMKVTMYFDAANFHHIRTEYKYIVEAKQGATAIVSSSSKPDYFTLEEDFDNFKMAGKLTLPTTYQITVTRELGNSNTTTTTVPTGTGALEVTALSQGSSGSFYWLMNIVNVYYNEQLDPAVFKVS
jgi:hypothetical protein